MSSPAESIRLPEQFGRYRIVRKLGEGGMGAVFLAHDDNLNRDVALKVCKQVDNARALERFRKEAEAAARLRHPHLCPVHDYGIHDDTAYIVMAYIPGQPLHKWLADHPLDFRRSAELVQTIALAMQEAHDGGVIHRDLKPANVIIDPRGDPVILDFGLARLSEARTQSSTNAIVGTPAYMAPEQALGQTDAIGPATDVYALGVVLYELLTGETPFLGTPQAVMIQLLAATPPPPRRIDPSVPAALEAVCLQAMAKKSEERYASMRDFAAALEQVVGTLSDLEGVRPKTPRLPMSSTGTASPEFLTWPTTAPLVPSLMTTRSRQPRAASRLRLGFLFVLLTLGLVAAVWLGIRWRSGVTDDGSANAKNQPVTRVDPSKDKDEKQADDTKDNDKGKYPIKPPDPVQPQPDPINSVPLRESIVVDLGGGVTLELVRIEPGQFRMGSEKAEQDAFFNVTQFRLIDEDPHNVEITKPFYLGKFTVTQEQYVRVTGQANPSHFSDEGLGKAKVNGKDTKRFPVETVSWGESVDFCDDLMKQHETQIPLELKRAGYRFALPTEAQWEYACRAGTTTAYHFGNKLNGTQANCNGNYPFGTDVKGPYLERTEKVGSYPANKWGLHDMHGNVWQWCADYSDGYYYKYCPIKDPVCLKKSPEERRVLRGGSWSTDRAWYCRAASRSGGGPTYRNAGVGFRVCLRVD